MTYEDVTYEEETARIVLEDASAELARMYATRHILFLPNGELSVGERPLPVARGEAALTVWRQVQFQPVPTLNGVPLWDADAAAPQLRERAEKETRDAANAQRGEAHAKEYKERWERGVPHSPGFLSRLFGLASDRPQRRDPATREILFEPSGGIVSHYVRPGARDRETLTEANEQLASRNWQARFCAGLRKVSSDTDSVAGKVVVALAGGTALGITETSGLFVASVAMLLFARGGVEAYCLGV